jgi:hypothetical protein
MIVVSVKKPRTMIRMSAPTFGIHLPRLRDTIATPIDSQMKRNLKR